MGRGRDKQEGGRERGGEGGNLKKRKYNPDMCGGWYTCIDDKV